MNPRILELAEQAGSTHKQNLGVYQFYTNELEKFAELLIRECAQYIFVLDAEPVSHKTAAALLLQHFEVKR